MISKEVLKKALSELGRVVLIAIIPVVISSVQSGKVDVNVIAVTAMIAGLKFIDKLLHELGVEEEEETGEESSLTKGLTRF